MEGNSEKANKTIFKTKNYVILKIFFVLNLSEILKTTFFSLK